MKGFRSRILPHVDAELALADEHMARGDAGGAFRHLERAHVLGQASTREHVRVHWRMLRWGVAQRAPREVVGQVTRILGAATKTFVGWVPAGNTGGANVSPIRRMPVPEDLAALIAGARERA